MKKQKILISVITLLLCLFGTNEIGSTVNSVQQHSNQSPDTVVNKYRSGPSRYQPSTGYRQNPARSTPSPTSPPINAERRTGAFLSHLGAFGAGAFLGSIFHPFGGGYYNGFGGFQSFSLIGLVVDIILILITFSLIRKLFRRRY